MPEPVALSHTSIEFEEKNGSSKESRSGIFSPPKGLCKKMNRDSQGISRVCVLKWALVSIGAQWHIVNYSSSSVLCMQVYVISIYNIQQLLFCNWQHLCIYRSFEFYLVSTFPPDVISIFYKNNYKVFGIKITKWCPLLAYSIKGKVPQDFRLQVFFMNQFPQAPVSL